MYLGHPVLHFESARLRRMSKRPSLQQAASYASDNAMLADRLLSSLLPHGWGFATLLHWVYPAALPVLA